VRGVSASPACETPTDRATGGSPPWLLEPVDIWRAYKRLASDKVRGNPAGTPADIVMLVRVRRAAALAAG